MLSTSAKRSTNKAVDRNARSRIFDLCRVSSSHWVSARRSCHNATVDKLHQIERFLRPQWLIVVYLTGMNYASRNYRRNCWLGNWYLWWCRWHLLQHQEHKWSKGTVVRNEGFGSDLGRSGYFFVCTSVAACTIQPSDVDTVRTPSWIWDSKV